MGQQVSFISRYWTLYILIKKFKILFISWLKKKTWKKSYTFPFWDIILFIVIWENREQYLYGLYWLEQLIQFWFRVEQQKKCFFFKFSIRMHSMCMSMVSMIFKWFMENFSSKCADSILLRICLIWRIFPKKKWVMIWCDSHVRTTEETKKKWIHQSLIYGMCAIFYEKIDNICCSI